MSEPLVVLGSTAKGVNQLTMLNDRFSSRIREIGAFVHCSAFCTFHKTMDLRVVQARQQLLNALDPGRMQRPHHSLRQWT